MVSTFIPSHKTGQNRAEGAQSFPVWEFTSFLRARKLVFVGHRAADAFRASAQYGRHGLFRSKFLTDNTKGLYDFLQKDFYRQPVLTPPMKVSGVAAPEMPHVSIKREGNTLHLSWKAVTSAVPVTYNIYRISKSATSVSRVSPLTIGAPRSPKDTLVLKNRWKNRVWSLQKSPRHNGFIPPLCLHSATIPISCGLWMPMGRRVEMQKA